MRGPITQRGMSEPDLPKINADLALLMRERLGIRRGETLAEKLRIAGRLVPRAQRRAGQILVEAEVAWENPKLRRRIDPATLQDAEKRLKNWLRTVDAADRRKGLILGILATLAFNFLVICAALITWLAWSGRL